MTLTTSQEREFQKGLDCADRVNDTINFLEQIASVYPPLQPTVNELRTRRDYLKQMCELALTIHNQSQA
jgi:hypothetical protein